MASALRITGIVRADTGTSLELPVYTCRVPAGFPSPADDHLDETLDLNKRYIRNPAATFFVFTDGDSMKDAGIHSGDMLIVDRSVKPTHGKVVIACIEGELTVKRYSVRGGRPFLVAENSDYPAIAIRDDQEVTILGSSDAQHSYPLRRPYGLLCPGRLQQFLRLLRAGVSAEARRQAGPCLK